MNFFEFANNVQDFSIDKFENELIVLIESSEKIKQLQENQFDDGLDSDGNFLGRYSMLTQILSGGKKAFGEPYNLLDTGDFRNKLKINNIKKSDDLSLFFDSKGKNTNNLLDLVGERMFGLQEKNINKLIIESKAFAIDVILKNYKLK